MAEIDAKVIKAGRITRFSIDYMQFFTIGATVVGGFFGNFGKVEKNLKNF